MYKALSPFQSHLYLEQVTSPCNKAESAYGAGADIADRLLTFYTQRARKPADTFQHIETRQFGRRVPRPILDSDTGGEQLPRNELLHPVPTIFLPRTNIPFHTFNQGVRSSNLRWITKEEPNSYKPCNCWVFSFFEGVIQGREKSKINYRF